jgi:hypothetical protein
MRHDARRTHHLVLGLVALGMEVEVVIERVVAALADCREHDAHVKLAPALLVDAERRLLEHCPCISILAMATSVAGRAHLACSSQTTGADCMCTSQTRWA